MSERILENNAPATLDFAYITLEKLRSNWELNTKLTSEAILTAIADFAIIRSGEILAERRRALRCNGTPATSAYISWSETSPTVRRGSLGGAAPDAGLAVLSVSAPDAQSSPVDCVMMAPYNICTDFAAVPSSTRSYAGFQLERNTWYVNESLVVGHNVKVSKRQFSQQTYNGNDSARL